MILLRRPAPAGRTQVWLALAVWAAAVACNRSPPPAPAPAPVPAPAPEAPTLIPDTDLGSRPKLRFLPLDASMLEWVGERDLTNRYASAVLVEPDEPGRSCNGVLIHPRLVLTAGHCLCAWRELTQSGSPKSTLIDTSACAKRAQVTAIHTTPVEGSSWPSLEVYERTGVVQPHPEFELHVDAHGTVESSHADLAVILLEKPIRGDIAPSLFADTEPRTNEFLAVAGYGTQEGLERLFGNRYSRMGKVRAPPAPGDDRIPYAPQGVHYNPSYQGGPCLREGEKGRPLFGIVGLGAEQEMSCTSTIRYRTWLRARLREAGAP